MKKKTSKKSEAPIKEVVEQAVEQIKEAAAAAEAKPKQRKMVEFKVLASILEFATEKARFSRSTLRPARKSSSGSQSRSLTSLPTATSRRR